MIVYKSQQFPVAVSNEQITEIGNFNTTYTFNERCTQTKFAVHNMIM